VKRLGLVQRFAIISLIVVAVMSLALGFAVTFVVEEIVLHRTAVATEIVANALIADAVDSSSLSAGLDPDEWARMDEIVEEGLSTGGVLTVKLWDRAGVLVYSSDSSDPIGASFADDDEVASSLLGETAAKIEHKGDEESADQVAEYGSVVEIYAPLYDTAGEQLLGVFEIYVPYAPVAADIQQATVIIWAIVIIGGAVVYLLQVTMVKRASDQLETSEKQVAVVNERLHSSMQNLEEHSLGTLQALITAVDAKDSYTATHSISTTDYAVAIGRRLGLTNDQLVTLERAGLLHDVGKIGIPEKILLKPGRLDAEERLIVEEHSDMSAHIVESIPFLRDLAPILKHHHERWDGKGYPDGIAGTDVPRLSRILACADAFDAMTSDRPYRQAMSIAAAREELVRWRGQQFAPEALDALLAALDAGEVTVAHWAAPAAAKSAIA
jgi:putative nucleotidyltransferase with HDIG domain